MGAARMKTVGSRRQIRGFRRSILVWAIAMACPAGWAQAQIADPFGDQPEEPRGQASRSQPSRGEEDRNREEARALVVAGVQSAQAGRWEEARTKFEQAYSIYPSPNILVNLGAAQVETGQLVEGAESYRTFLAEANDPRLADRRQAVQEQLTVLEARIPRLSAQIEGLELGDDVDIDGRATSEEALRAGVPLNPGAHRLVVRRSGAVLAEREVSLAERQPQSIALDVRPPPEEVSVEEPTEQVSVDLGSDRAYRESRVRTMQAMLGTSTVLVVGSVIVGGMARRENNDGDADTARRDALRMTSIGLAGGALLFGIIGAAIYATDDRSLDVFGSLDGGGLRLRGTF